MKHTRKLQIIEDNLYTPSTNLTSIIYYRLWKSDDEQFFVQLIETKTPKGRKERKSPGVFSKQLFAVNDFTTAQLLNKNISLKLTRAFNSKGIQETPTNINDTKGFLRPVFLKFHEIYSTESSQ